MASSDTDTWTVYGLHDGPCRSPRLSPFDSKLGGYPDFFENCLLTSAPLCNVCHSSQGLVAQIYCPLEDSPFHRLLHVFSCTEKRCWSSSKSWLVLRSQCLDPSYASDMQEKKEPEESGKGTHEVVTEDWCSGADDWLGDDIPDCSGEDSIIKKSHDLHDVKTYDQLDVKESCDLPNKYDVPSTNGSCDVPDESCDLCTTQHGPDSASIETMATAEAKSGTGSSGHNLYTGPAYPSCYVRVAQSWDSACGGKDRKVEELLQRYSMENPDSPALSNNKLTGNSGGGSGRVGGKKRSKGRDNGSCISTPAGETYEKGVAKHGDIAFMKFQKSLAKCPQQLLRYCWKGEAIYMTQTDSAMHVEACPACGAERVYECQLMPQAVYFLQKGLGSDSHSGKHAENLPPLKHAVEFGTVIIYTCSKSCWNPDQVLNRNDTSRQNQTWTSSETQLESDNHLIMFRQELIFVQTE